MGVSAPYCVKATALSAIYYEKRVLTSRQLIASQTYRQEEFDEALLWFQRNCLYLPYYLDLVDLMQRKKNSSEAVIN